MCPDGVVDGAEKGVICNKQCSGVLQCVAVRCSVLQCVAVCCSVLQCVAVCCRVLQCVVVRCSALQCNGVNVVVMCHVQSSGVLQCVVVCCSVLQCVAVWSSVLQCVAVRCSALQCVAVCCGWKYMTTCIDYVCTYNIFIFRYIHIYIDRSICWKHLHTCVFICMYMYIGKGVIGSHAC